MINNKTFEPDNANPEMEQGSESIERGSSESRGEMTENSTQNRRSNRGFASMDPERQRQIASEGGRAAHRQGVAHKWTSQEASEAGRKGGQNSRGGGRSRSNKGIL